METTKLARHLISMSLVSDVDGGRLGKFCIKKSRREEGDLIIGVRRVSNCKARFRTVKNCMIIIGQTQTLE